MNYKEQQKANARKYKERGKTFWISKVKDMKGSTYVKKIDKIRKDVDK
jgi:hypothetical protein